MITLLKQGEVFAPEPSGKKDILIAGTKIAAVTEPGEVSIQGVELQTIDCSGMTVIPGFVDSHVHILGGGGEGGPSSRAPEIAVEDIISCGVTTVIGCLGTDSITRHMESLLAKAMALEDEGVSTYIFSGSYVIPPKTITGSVRSDLVLIDKVIGAGEIAISDHRSSQPTYEELARLAADCRVGGMLGGKAGILHLHVGDGSRRLEMLFRLIKETEIPAAQVIPTHVNRHAALFEEAMEFALLGGCIDMTAGIGPEFGHSRALNIEKAISLCQDKKVLLKRITISSDSNGSMPVFDQAGQLAGLTIATEKDLFDKFKALVQTELLTLSQAVCLFSANPADIYKLHDKGGIREGKDADLLVLDKNLCLVGCFSRGKQVISESRILVRGTFSSNRKARP